MKEKKFTGLSVSKGIAIGAPYFLSVQNETIPEFPIGKKDIEKEISRFRDALVSSRQDLVHLQRSLVEEGAPEIVAILDTHLEMLQDPFITTEIEDKISRMCKNAESVFLQVISEYKARFSSVNDQFFQDRVRDITDVSKRILSHLCPFRKVDLSQVPLGSILLGEELVPSSIAEASSKEIIGFVSKLGGISSHSGIIARAKGIPFIADVDVNELFQEKIAEMIVDGIEGKIIINPSFETKRHYLEIQKQNEEYFEMLEKEAHLHAETIDGYSVRIYGNLENLSDIELLKKNGACGIGLFRSEYLFLSKNRFPTENEQFEIYKKILESLPNHPVVIRVFDVGGDKTIENQNQEDQELKRELNPVLGCRAIRFLLRYEELFASQLRALLRASIYGNIHILIPMVSDVSELRAVKRLIATIQKELRQKQIPFKERIPIGCMIEVPSSAIMSDTIAEEVDFLSIGTNDLIQYVVAADRSNPHINYLYSPAHPSILRLLRVIISAANRHKRKLILCGEAASDPKYIPLLLGSGIRELSVAARHIPIIKHAIRSISIVDASQVAEQAFSYASIEELYEFMNEKNSQTKA